jgi:sugar lactone lactonase YvrE
MNKKDERMRLEPSHKFLTAIASAALLAGCSAGASSIGTPSNANNAPMSGVVQKMPGALGSPDASAGRVVYTSSFSGQPGSPVGQVLVYPASLKAHNPSPMRIIGQGTDRPFGMWVDSKGTLYVANIPGGNGGNYVAEFHPGASSPFRTLTDQLYYPTEVAVGADGTVYVNERQGPNVGGLEDHVTVFSRGSTHASHVIDMHFTGYDMNANQMAFDKNGDLLVSASAFRVDGSRSNHIFRMNTKTFNVTEVKLNGLPDGPGLAVDGAGNIYVSGATSFTTAVYAPGSKNPSRVIPHFAEDLAVMPDGTLYAMTGSGVNEYLPGGSSPVNVISEPTGNEGYGIAVGPAH